MNRPIRTTGESTSVDRQTDLDSLGVAGPAAAAPTVLGTTPAHPARTSTSVQVDWNGPSTVSRTTPTLQVVVNPSAPAS